MATIQGTGNLFISGNVSNAHANDSLVKAGTGTLTLAPASGTNTWTGNTTVSGGVLDAVDGTGLPTASRLVLNGGGIFQSHGTFTRDVNTDEGGVQWSNNASGGFAARGGDLVVQLNGGSGSLTWGEGSFVRGSGTLVFGSTSADSLVDFQNALSLGASGTNTRTIQVNNNANSAMDIARISGVISGSASNQLNKTGAGTLELTQTNTYMGATTITNGTLLISGGGSINGGSNGISVNGAGAIFRYDSTTLLSKTVTFGVNGGTFLYNSAAKYTGGSGSITADTGDTIGGDGALGHVTLASGGTLSPGELGLGSAGELTVDSLTLQSGSTSQFDVLNASSFDSIHSTGTKTLAGTLNLNFGALLASNSRLDLFTGGAADSLTGNFTTINAAGAYSGSFVNVDGFYQLSTPNQLLIFNHETGELLVNAIPEPSTILLLSAGLMSLLFRRRTCLLNRSHT